MKLILLTALVLKYTVEANEQFPFGPQFHKPSQGGYGSESSIFLPPESHTPIPYYPVKNLNNLPFPYLPPTGTKAPSVYPTPFPVILSSTLIPIFDDDEDEKEGNKKINSHQISSSSTHTHQLMQNISENTPRNPMPIQKRDMRATPKMANYHNPIDRIDMRFPQHFMGQSTPNPVHQTPKNMIINTHRNDHVYDQIKSPSSQNPHYVTAHGFTISSTTEPAIPILRLSNEMDLDGSFSYEALGADQTHYVQHSHMENLGSDKQEQVVEGSYSYVGDNGQTYTVHYIADSNGFRASGDHLPVAPPIPEIIQRAVQYNLAEEAKKPPHLRDWQDNEKDFDSSDKGHFAAPPPRNLFTGRTPEAFSYSFAQGSNNENTAAGGSQIPVKTNADFIIDQSRAKSSISPQITFLASQGAHTPSVNQPSPQQSISRIFNNDKSMPQLINYEAGNKDAELEGNKALWRWQYGLNPNPNLSQTPEKNTISRSFGEGDDIMINFNDMTPEQYTKMLESQLETINKDGGTSSVFYSNYNQYNDENENNNHMAKIENKYEQQLYQSDSYHSSTVNTVQNPRTEPQSATTTVSYTNSSPINYIKKDTTKLMSNNFSSSDIYNTFSLPSQSESSLYEYQEIPYDIKRTKALHANNPMKSVHNVNSIPVAKNANKLYFDSWTNNKITDNEPNTITQVPLFHSTTSKPPFLNTYEQKSDFQPMYKPLQETRETTTNAPQTTTENMFRTNIFLKSISSSKKSDTLNSENKKIEEPIKEKHNYIEEESKYIMQIPNNLSAETKADKYPKFIPHLSKTTNDVKNTKPKLADVLNYITNKNPFESTKLKPKSNMNYNNYDQGNEMNFEIYQPNQQENNNEEEDDFVQRQPQPPSFPRFNREQRDELRGVIKNYKVLHRKSNSKSLDQNGYHLRKEITQPSIRTLQSSGLPPLGRAGPSMKSYLPPIYV